MKKVFKLMLLSSVVFLASCGDDDEVRTEEDFLMKSWKLDSYVFTNIPAEFSYWGDEEFTNIYGESAYLLSFDQATYTRGMTFTFQTGGDTTVSETGEYTFADGELLLDPTGQGLSAFGIQLSKVFVVETITENDLVISTEETQFLTTNAFQDTLTQEYIDYLNTLTEAQYDSVLNVILKPVTVDVTYDFDLDLN